MGVFNSSLWLEGGIMKKHIYLMVITALGISMFFVIGKFLAIPTPLPNFSLFLQYAVLIVFSFYFGPVVGFSVGFLGHLLIDLFSGYGLWFSWIISSGIFGLLVGLASLCINKWFKNPYKVTRMLLFVLSVIVTGALCWVLISPLGDMWFYQEPYNVVILEGTIAFATNVASALLVGLPLIYGIKYAHMPYTIVKKSN